MLGFRGALSVLVLLNGIALVPLKKMPVWISAPQKKSVTNLLLGPFHF